MLIIIIFKGFKILGTSVFILFLHITLVLQNMTTNLKCKLFTKLYLDKIFFFLLVSIIVSN
jgi:hypothetical protein